MQDVKMLFGAGQRGVAAARARRRLLGFFRAAVDFDGTFEVRAVSIMICAVVKFPTRTVFLIRASGACKFPSLAYNQRRGRRMSPLASRRSDGQPRSSGGSSSTSRR